MADKSPSDDQKKIINSDTGNILVPAAAGSGKTTVMIERIIAKIIKDIKDDSIPEEKKHSFDSILVVTFTIAAAEHMLDAYPGLRAMYAPGDGNTAVFALENGSAVISSFTAPPAVFEI